MYKYAVPIFPFAGTSALSIILYDTVMVYIICSDV